MLTGMIPVTSGCAFVGGRDVKGDMVSIRHNLGVCPQHDILYPDLTVREHLRMYAVLKNVPGRDLKSVIQARGDTGFLTVLLFPLVGLGTETFAISAVPV